MEQTDKYFELLFSSANQTSMNDGNQNMYFWVIILLLVIIILMLIAFIIVFKHIKGAGKTKNIENSNQSNIVMD